MRTRIRELADPDLKDCVHTSINSPLLKDYRCFYLYDHLMPTCLSILMIRYSEVSLDHLHNYLKVYLRSNLHLLLKLCTILGSLVCGVAMNLFIFFDKIVSGPPSMRSNYSGSAMQGTMSGGYGGGSGEG